MQYIERDIDKDLINWKNQPSRKPLLIRGARQVGKSSTVRNLGITFEFFIEVDFISNKSIHKLFEGDINPISIYEELFVLFHKAFHLFNSPWETGRKNLTTFACY